MQLHTPLQKYKFSFPRNWDKDLIILSKKTNHPHLKLSLEQYVN